MADLNAAFWKWFGKSVVRNKDGTPKVVYHGTLKKFKKFNMKKCGIGCHFGDEYQARDRAYNLIACYLSIQNPIRMQDRGQWDAQQLFLGMREAIPYHGLDNKVMDDPNGAKLIKEFLESEGYDGIVYRNTFEGAFDEDGNDLKPRDSYIAFYPSQIKSVDNDGTWDRDDPSIRSNPPKLNAAFEKLRADGEGDVDLVGGLVTAWITVNPGWVAIYEFSSHEPMKGNARKALKELRKGFKAKIVVIDPGLKGDESRTFWDKMASEGLVDRMEGECMEWDDDPDIGSNPPTHLDFVKLPSGTRLFHGTDAKHSFKTLAGPAWLAENIDQAQLWVGWKSIGGGGKRRVLEYETTRDMKLVNVTAKAQWEKLGSALLDDPEPYIWTLADRVREAKYDGWWSRDAEVLISNPSRVLKFIKTLEFADEDAMRVSFDPDDPEASRLSEDENPPRWAYHDTDTQNLPSIGRLGLLPHAPDDSEQTPVVFFTDRKSNCYSYRGKSILRFPWPKDAEDSGEAWETVSRIDPLSVEVLVGRKWVPLLVVLDSF